MVLRTAGCLTCKSRRIKCDGTRPACQRCVKSGRTCHGLPDGTPIVHMENAYASGKQKRPRGPRPTAAIVLPESSHAVPRQLELDLEVLALSYYQSQHLRSLADTPSLVQGIADAVSPNWTAHLDLPLFKPAVSSMALALFSRTQYHPHALAEGSARYQQLLRSAQNIFRIVNEDSIDACLLAIFFMSRYEDAIHVYNLERGNIPLTSTLHSMRHHDGAKATLNLWKNRIPHTRPPSDVIKHTRRGLLRSAIMRGIAVPEWMLDGASYGERGLDLEYDRIVVRVIAVREQLSELLLVTENMQTASACTVKSLRQISQEAKDIDLALQKWAAHFPEAWSYQQHVLPQSTDYPTEDHYSSLSYTYSSYAHAAVWNIYYAMRMLINNTRLKIPHLAPSNADDISYEYHADSISTMEAMADSLAASVPFSLQRASPAPHNGTSTNEEAKPYIGSLTVWPLTIASSLTFLKARKKAWFRKQLSRFGRDAGYGVLEGTANQPWLEL